MLAWLQRFLTFGLLCASLAWAVFFGSAGRWTCAIVGSLLILGVHAVILGIEFTTLYLVQRNATILRATVLQLMRTWGAEVLTTARVFYWRQPFRSLAETDNIEFNVPRRGVVFVHGFVCNRGLWNPLMRWLRARQVPFVAVNLEPLFGSIDQYSHTIEAAVVRIESLTGMSVVLIGHSMGGLAIRAWLARFAAKARVYRVITVASPHQGTWLARFGKTTNGRQMRMHSPWLAELAAQESPETCALFTCFFGHCDNIVFPVSCGRLPGAANIHVPNTAHMEMAFTDEVFSELCRWLDLWSGSDLCVNTHR